MDAVHVTDLTPRLAFECPAPLIERLVVRYAEAHRRYHTWAHVLACFEARDQLTSRPCAEIDLALLFHDAIYEPLAGDNERRSAGLLLEEGRREWINEDVLQRAHDLVLATKHGDDSGTDTEQASLVLDADLSILGAAPAMFDAYERDVRLEFSAVGDETFAVGRARILRKMLSRATIYATRRGQHLWEERARSNLERSLARLGR